MRFWPFVRRAPDVTLASELQRAEREARAAYAGPGSYSRSLLADRSGVTKDTVSAWLDGSRVPKDFSALMKAVNALSALAGAGPPADQHWHELWTAARRGPQSGQPGHGSLRHRTQVIIASFAAAAATAVIGGFFTPLGGDLLGLVTSKPAPAAATAGKLDFSFVDYSNILADHSVAARGIGANPGSSFPAGIKVGSKAIQLAITNEYPRTVTITDIELVNLKRFAAVSGTLFSSNAQGVGPDDLLGVNLGDHSPLLRHANAEGTLTDPFFGDSNITINPHRTESLVIRIYAGAPASFTWQFKVSYHVGQGARSVIPQAQPDLLRITGYAKSYQRAYYQEGAAWVQRPGTNLCPVPGTSCGGTE